MPAKHTDSTHPDRQDELVLWVLLTALALICIGLVAIASATSHKVGSLLDNRLLITHAQAIGIAGAVCVCMWFWLPLNWLRDQKWIAIAALLFMGTPFIPGIGIEVNGALRWSDFVFVTLQPSEIARPLLLVAVCAYSIAVPPRKIKALKDLMPLVPLFVGYILAGTALFAQNDYGSLLLLSMVIGAVMLLAGAGRELILIGIAVIICASLVFILSSDERLDRIVGFWDLLDKPKGNDWQQLHALTAWIKGGWTGVGLGLSMAKWGWVYSSHSDFILSIIAEEVGIIGIFVILGLFFALCIAAWEIADLAESKGNKFGALLGRGIAIMLFAQVYIHIGTNVAALPPKGITLPLVSHGGSSIIAWMVTLMLLVLIERANLKNDGLPQKQ